MDFYFNVGYTTYLSHTVRSTLALVGCTSLLYKKVYIRKESRCDNLLFNWIFLRIIKTRCGIVGGEWGDHKNPHFATDSCNAYGSNNKSNLSSRNLSPVSNLGDIL